MSLQYLHKPAYSNWLMLDPNGIEMCRCADKRAKWYLDRNLADIVNEDPPTFKLKFAPNGNGNKDDAYSLAQKFNRCAVCGTEDELTKHHIVPYMYRKWFPTKLKGRSAHDVVVICVTCHENYETSAMILKKQISLEITNNTQLTTKLTAIQSHNKRIARLCSALLKDSGSIPNSRKDEIISNITEHLGYKPSITDLNNLIEISKAHTKCNQDPGKEIVECVIKDNNLDCFIRRWRQHFIDIACPMFMPEHWSIERRSKIE
jgi:hypothetical protein